MAATETLTNLRSRAFTLADQTADKFISTTEMTFFLNSAGAAFYRKFVQSGLIYYVSSDTVSAVAGTASYALPATYYATLSVEYSDSGVMRPLTPIPVKETHLYTYGRDNPSRRYLINGSNLTLYPTPSTAGTYIHRYVPTYTKLVSGNDTIDGINGLEEWMVVSAARDCYLKEESNPGHLNQKLAELERDIIKAGADRMLATYGRVGDTDELGSVDFDPHLEYLRLYR